MTTETLPASALNRDRLAAALTWAWRSAELGVDPAVGGDPAEASTGAEVGGRCWHQGEWLVLSPGDLECGIRSCLAGWLSLEASAGLLASARPLDVMDDAAAWLLGYVPTRTAWDTPEDPATYLAELFSGANTLGAVFDIASELAEVFGQPPFEVGEDGVVR